MTIEQLYRLYTTSSGVTTDTRKIQPENLYVALKGDRFDGNEFVASALASGCQAAITDNPEVAKKNSNAYLVDDALIALQQLAAHHRQQLTSTRFIGMTGSNGKTTTKELLRDTLATTYKTYATKGNLNNHIGVPLSLLEVTHEHQFAIIEMGANAQGEIAFLSDIAQPEFGLITNIGKAHLEGFGGISGVKKGKRELFTYIKNTGGKAFVNASDPVLLEISEGMQRILYGTDVDSPEVYVIKKSPTLSIGWSHHSYFSTEVTTQLVGTYNLPNIAAAIAIGRHFNVESEKINAALSAYTPDNNRSEKRKTERNVLILDAYNANPSSMREALHSFASSDFENRLCILADMFELGAEAPDEHQSIVSLCQTLKLEAWFVGKLFLDCETPDFQFFKTTDDLVDRLKDKPLSGKTILLKGSRGMALEKAVPCL